MLRLGRLRGYLMTPLECSQAFTWLFLAIVLFMLQLPGSKIMGISAASGYHDDVPIFWAPVIDRQNLTNAVTDVFNRDSPEKVQRISKMLNNSIDAQQKELYEGQKKLEDLRHIQSNFSHRTAIISCYTSIHLLISFIVCVCKFLI